MYNLQHLIGLTCLGIKNEIPPCNVRRRVLVFIFEFGNTLILRLTNLSEVDVDLSIYIGTKLTGINYYPDQGLIVYSFSNGKTITLTDWTPNSGDELDPCLDAWIEVYKGEALMVPNLNPVLI